MNVKTVVFTIICIATTSFATAATEPAAPKKADTLTLVLRIDKVAECLLEKIGESTRLEAAVAEIPEESRERYEKMAAESQKSESIKTLQKKLIQVARTVTNKKPNHFVTAVANLTIRDHRQFFALSMYLSELSKETIATDPSGSVKYDLLIKYSLDRLMTLPSKLANHAMHVSMAKNSLALHQDQVKSIRESMAKKDSYAKRTLLAATEPVVRQTKERLAGLRTTSLLEILVGTSAK